MSAPDTEKISINMGVVDLGQMDLLIEQGFYSNRTDFIRTATRNLLQTHAPVVQGHLTSKLLGLGVAVYGKASLERYLAKDTQVDVRLVGLVSIAPDVTPELAKATIKSIKVLGVFRASDAVRKALADRMED